jgi:hypothetical protein
VHNQACQRRTVPEYVSACERSIGHLPPQPGFPTPDAGDQKFNSRPVVPTILQKEALRPVGGRTFALAFLALFTPRAEFNPLRVDVEYFFATALTPFKAVVSAVQTRSSFTPTLRKMTKHWDQADSTRCRRAYPIWQFTAVRPDERAVEGNMDQTEHERVIVT